MTVETAAQRPGVVLFAAVLNFVSALLWLAGTVGAFLVLVLGMAASLSQAAASYIPPSLVANASSSTVLAVVGILVIAMTLSSAVSFLFLGIGLLKGSRLTWYLQAVLSVLGLFFFPIGTALNALILVFFFQRRTRDFFGIR